MAPISHVEFDPTTEDGRLAGVLDDLCQVNDATFRRRGRQELPSRAAVAALVEDSMAVLYPVHFGSGDATGRSLRSRIALRLDELRERLEEQARRGFEFVCEHRSHRQRCPDCALLAAEVADALVARLPSIRRMLDADLQAAFDGDPALRSIDEALFCYPGVRAILQHRLAHELYRLDVPLLPRIISELAHSETGIDIHPGAKIAPSFFIDHGTGVVIGETAVIGERVRLYQGVTLGARSFASDEQGRLIKGVPRHPIVEDDVVIYAGATILGRITIGRGTTIGGNVWLTRSVAPGSRVRAAQARQETFENGSGI
ncbi:MAG TPA: serine O-acetyltransferase EpsC [Polyangiaceae bacterium]|nr:serine O-acetyltransferase EpsC [Polyangiaceae bacterium]